MDNAQLTDSTVPPANTTIVNDQQATDMPTYQRCDTFYFQDVVLLVEDCLFRVPRRNFEQGSEIFRNMFSVPQPDSGHIEGLSDEYPLRLEGVRKDDMIQLLRVMFPMYNDEGTIDSHSLNTDQWLSVHNLATMWNFSGIQALAGKALDDLLTNPVDRVILAEKHHQLQHWLVPALNQLAQRDHGVTPSEADKLGIDVVLKVSHVRECETWWRSCVCSCGALDYFPSDVDVVAVASMTVVSGGTHRKGCRLSNPKRSAYDFSDLIRSTFNLT